MVKFKDDIVWGINEPITVTLMNFMAFNDIFVRNHFIECKVGSIDSGGQPKAKRWVVNHAAVFARTITVTPGNNLQYDSDGWPYFSKTYSFPGNNYWDNDYKPTVTLCLEGNRALPMSIILNTVTPNQITYTVYILEKRTLDSSREFKINILAFGIKPVEDNNLDSEVDPSP